MRKNLAGRNPDGTFAPGNPDGPGRPPRATEAAYLRVMMNACDLETWQAIVERAVADAKNGDGAARAWLASYLVGKPSNDRAAPRPSRVLALEESGVDEVADELESIRRAREFDELLRPALKMNNME